MNMNRHDFEQGIIRLEGITLSADSTLEEMEKLYGQAPDLFISKLELRTMTYYGFRDYASHNGISMMVHGTFENGRLTKIELSPVKEKKRNGYFEAIELEEDYELSCQFLDALIGCTAKKYDWGKIETYLFPDYHDSYHGGDVYITYHAER